MPLLTVAGGAWDGVPLVTKAGGLGTDGALGAAVAAVRAAARDGGADTRPLVAITMGDPCGIGPEIIAKTLAGAGPHRLARFVVIGSPERMQFGVDACAGVTLAVNTVARPEDAKHEPGTIDVYSPFAYDLDRIETGVVGPEAGRCAAEWVIAATKLAVAGRIDAIATAPLNKEARRKRSTVPRNTRPD